jgi:hypothetical protein
MTTTKKMTLAQRRKLIVQLVKSRKVFRKPVLTPAELAAARDAGLSLEPTQNDLADELGSMSGFRTVAKDTSVEEMFYGVVEDAAGDD